ncbi:hypothetical protein DBV05_g7834 [Lasiodiplodia theobromae]|uniref:Metallo-beta-lactamase domain-containing protein n=1 Tax=Lasiodiplodia theobromae TaxID=45133 RepID=A0A5N5D7E2_9PEZI|nr:hypothetical protein DBV05_g7834 [Lasiodiplodia theobromae]
MPSPLRADLYNAPAIPTTSLLPDGTPGLWQPTVVTLISGATSAVLIDTLFTTDQGIALADWIAATLSPANKTLATIYITHGHGDHWFNLRYLLTRFPGVRVLATRAAIDHMRTQQSPAMRGFWQTTFPGQIGDDAFEILVTALPDDNTFEVEGHKFVAVDAGHSDTDATTFLHVPALRMVVAGDIVYNDVHMWMAETLDDAGREAWVAALDRIEAVEPAVVVGSHHRLGGVDGVWNVEASREYVRTFGRLVGESGSAEELYGRVVEAYPGRVGRLVLWLGCKAAFAEGRGV